MNKDVKCFLSGAAIFALILSTLIGSIIGACDGDWHKCEPFGTKRFHYLIPSYVASCATMRYLTNKEEIFKTEEEMQGYRN